MENDSKKTKEVGMFYDERLVLTNEELEKEPDVERAIELLDTILDMHREGYQAIRYDDVLKVKHILQGGG